MNNYKCIFYLNIIYKINNGNLNVTGLKKVFCCQRRLKSKVAHFQTQKGYAEDNDVKDITTLETNKEKNVTLTNKSSKLFTNHRSITKNKNLSNLENILTDDKNSKYFYLHHRPTHTFVPITGCDDFIFLKTHRNLPHIDSQISDYFQDKHKELIWQEIQFDWRTFYRPYLKLSKIRLTGLVVLTSMAGFAMAPGEFVLSNFLLLSGGVCLTSAAANTINQFFEVPFDSQMNRTKNRPLVCGNLSTQSAIYFAIGSAVSGSTILYMGLNPLTCFLGVTNLLLYTLVYTPLKRVNVANTWVGSVVGAIPPIMGWTAVTGSIEPGGLLLGALLFAWQFPHFCALSWNLKSEYSRAGYQMMSTVTPYLCRSTALRYSILLTPLCTLLSQVGITTWHFAILSLPPNAYMAFLAWRFYRDADANSSRKLFRYSLIYLPILFALIFATKNDRGTKVKIVE